MRSKIPTIMARSVLIATFFCTSFLLTLGGYKAYSQMTYVPVDSITSCFATSTDPTFASTCLHATIKKLLSSHSSWQIMEYATASTSPEVIQRNCHSIGHIIGSETYSKIGAIEPALASCSNKCSNACTHGVIGAGVLKELGESYAEDDISHADDETVKRIGKPYCDKSVPLCHAIGHILYILHKDDPGSFQICTDISSGFEREACYQGIYMERAGTGEALDPFPATSTYAVSSGDYTFPCLAVAPEYRHACFQFLPLFQRPLFKSDGIDTRKERLKKQILTCSSLDVADRAYCFEGVGLYAADITLATTCNAMPTLSDREACTLGVIPQNFFHGTYGLKYCDSIAESARQTLCFNSSFRWMDHLMTDQQMRDQCEKEQVSSCVAHLKDYVANREQLPDYRFGLYGEPSAQ